MTAYLIFDDPPPSLPDCVQHLMPHLRKGDAPLAHSAGDDATADMDLERPLEIRGKNGFSLTLSLGAHDGDASIQLVIAHLGDDEPESRDLLPRLAFLTYQLVKCTSARAVIWPGTETELPRADFLKGLEASFSPDHVIPRRVSASGFAPRPQSWRLPAYRPPQTKTRGTDKRYTAHIAAYEAHLRRILTSPATEAELADAKARRAKRDPWAPLDQLLHHVATVLGGLRHGRLVYSARRLGSA